MSFPGLSLAEMRDSLGELEQALFHHEQWYEALTRTLVCHQAPDQRDIDPDAERKCRFGQWLHGSLSHKLEGHPSFAEITALHRRMHRCAAEMLIASAQHRPIALDAYERFNTALKQMRLEVASTKHELEDAIYNLDPLTGVASRIGMLTKLREQQTLVQRKLQSCCVAMMDVDRFKCVNDSYGHAMGDRVLIAFARHVMAHMRPYDMLFRYGGEEFLFCAPNSDLKDGHDAVDRLREGLAALKFETDGGLSFQVTASFGLTLLDPDVSVEQSIARADQALYAAKAAGRNRVVVWDPTMTHNGSNVTSDPAHNGSAPASTLPAAASPATAP